MLDGARKLVSSEERSSEAGSIVWKTHTSPTRNWPSVLEKLDFAFQPIVNVHNGVSFGFEALLRGYEAAGFDAIIQVFDEAYRDGILYDVELSLREKAIAKFSTIPGCDGRKLFYNLDNRFIELPDYHPGGTAVFLQKNGVPATAFYLEVSEQHDVHGAHNLDKVFAIYRKQGYKLALDDYGVGFSQLRMLYYCEPDVIKVDRFFISGIQNDRKKEMLVAHLVNMAHLMGASVIAEGVETVEEYFVCKRLGCDLIQGYLVHRPTRSVEELLTRYPEIEVLALRDRRNTGDDCALISSRLKNFEPIPVSAAMPEIFDYFHENKEVPVVPVVDEAGHPVGLIREADFKTFSYALYGRELMHNPSVRPSLERFLRRCPVVNLSDSVERILEIFTASEHHDGVIVVENMQYVGLLDGFALLELLNEKNTVAARDQNPLTQLPGNNAIYRYASQILAGAERPCQFYYFDFDNFKPFNDAFGFRQGDRAIVLFADILRKALIGRRWFIGHVGGDDYFVGAQGMDEEDALEAIRKVIERFCVEITTFYDAESRARGYLEGVDRHGVNRRFPLLTVSVAALQLPPCKTTLSFDDIAPLIFDLKKNAKASSDHICCAALTSSFPQ